MFSIENATSIGKQAFDPHTVGRGGPSTNISVCLLTILPRSRSNGEEFCGVHEILKEYRRDQRESLGMLSLIFHEISLVWQFEPRCNQYSKNRNHLCVLLSIFWTWIHWIVYIYIYVCEFNFVSRNIGKVGKIGLLKNDLWFWNKNILQEWNLKIVKLINLDLCQFFERWMKYILNLVFILGWENWFAIYLWKNVLKYKYFRY